MIVGFTGTREGMSWPQSRGVFILIDQFLRARDFDEVEFHHGDCVGADLEFQMLISHASSLMMPSPSVVIHPPDNPASRAFCEGSTILPERPYLKRNEDIALGCDVLIAAPKQMVEERRSGTWHTIRRAREAGKVVYLVLRDGTYTREVGGARP